MDAVNDFKSIRSKLERQDQKAEFEAKNPAPVSFHDVMMRTNPLYRMIQSNGLKMSHGSADKEG